MLSNGAGAGILLDQLGCQLLGSGVAWNQAVYRLVKDNKQGGPATIVNYGDKAPVDDAAFVNGTFGQGCELDDYYDQGGGHPGAASLPVALALAEKTAAGVKSLSPLSLPDTKRAGAWDGVCCRE